MKSCGGCTLCCDLVPVDAATLKKPGFTPCRHLRDMLLVAGPGCGIYDSRPRPCRVWACVWLTSPDLPAELRPDRCGVVLDPVVDLIRVNGVEKAAAQIWVAPGHENAFEIDIVHQAILGLLEQVPFVLWRQRGADGAQWARAIGRDGDGNLGIGALVRSDFSLGTEAERWARLDQLRGKARGSLLR
jgi:hypothetical protein